MVCICIWCITFFLHFLIFIFVDEPPRKKVKKLEPEKKKSPVLKKTSSFGPLFVTESVKEKEKENKDLKQTKAMNISDKSLPKSKQSPRKNVKESSGKRSSISICDESSDEEIVTKKEPMSVLSKKSKSPSPKRTSPRRSYKKRKDSKQDYNDVDGDFSMDDVDEIVDNISEIKKSPKTRKSSPRVKQSPTKPKSPPKAKSPPKTKQPSPKTKQSNTKKEKSKYIVIGDEDEKDEKDDKDVKMEELTDSNGKPVPVPSKKFNPFVFN